MKTRHIPESHTSHPNVTPLIDIVMCLIVFYMLCAKIGVNTGAEKIDIPESIVGTQISDMGNALVLNVRPGAFGDEPQVTALVKSSTAGEPKQTELHLREPGTNANQLINTLKFYKGQNKELKVIIRGEADMEYRFLEPILVACADAGVRNVNFNTKIVKSTE